MVWRNGDLKVGVIRRRRERSSPGPGVLILVWSNGGVDDWRRGGTVLCDVFIVSG